MAADDDTPSSLTGDDRIVEEARKRFIRCREWQGEADKNWLEDTKFANADERNRWQWPNKTLEDRDADSRPCLTINKTRVHNNIVINESLKNKSAITIRPTGGIASYKGSQAYKMLIRRIEAISGVDAVYEKAFRDQVDGGVGYVIVDTDYMSDRTFDQDIFFRRCRDPLCVYIDPDCEDPAGLDADFGFTFDRMSRDKFNREYPKWKNEVGQAPLGADELWLNKTDITVAMYYRRSGKRDKFVSYVDPDTGDRSEMLASELRDRAGPEIADRILAQIDDGEIDGRTRDVLNRKVEWFKIAGDKIIARGPWIGRYIPIVRCDGVATVIEGKLDRKGHTRSQIGPQRMLNYNASGAIEFGALQGKTPWVGPARAFEGQEQWKDANRKNYAFLAYNDVDEESDSPELGKIDKPTRTEPPTSAPVFMQGMQDAERQLMMVTGQYQSQMGEEDMQAAASGKAINARQRQGDTVTYHFVEHQSDMIRALGVQCIDLIPKVYDTERMLQVLDDDGTKLWIRIKPGQQEAYKELEEKEDEAKVVEFNPLFGEYECVPDVGPSFATQRQEAWSAIATLLAQSEQLVGVVGDLLFQYGDFPGAEDIRERLRKEIEATKPYLFNDQQNPSLVALQQKIQQLTALNGELLHKMALRELSQKQREEKRDIDATNAETNRLKVVLDAMAKIEFTPAQRAKLEHELLRNSHSAVLDMIFAQNEADIRGWEIDRQGNGGIA